MLRHLPLSLSTLILLLLSKTAWALGVAFTNAAFEGIARGTPFDIEWVGDGTPVTILLLTGPAENLQTVETIVESATTSPYTWTPPQTLPAGVYALSIAQSGSINYSARFQIAAADASGVAVGATASSSAPFSSATGTGTSSDVVFPTYNAVFNQTSVNSSGIVNATATTASQTYSLPYSRPYGTAGIVNGNGTTLGVATGVVGGDKVILSFEGGAGLGKRVGITLLGVASGVGIWFGGWMIW